MEVANMATRLPLPLANSNIVGYYNDFIKNKLAQAQSQRMEAQNQRAQEMQPYSLKHLMAQTAGLEGAESRAQKLLNPRLQALKDAHEAALRRADPNYEAKQFITTLQALGQIGKQRAGGAEGAGGPQGPGGTPQPNFDALKAKMAEMGEPSLQGIGQGQRAFPTEEMQQESESNLPQVPNMGGQKPNQMPQQNEFGIDLNNLNPMQKAFVASSKFKDLLKESPEQKNQRELIQKQQLEDYKTQQKIILEQEKSRLKNEATKQEAITEAKNDIPQLERTLKSLKLMKEIAENDKSLFGHTTLGFASGERYARTTDNPNAGTWQTLGLNPIIEAENSLSGRGNQLALKTSLANKPNFSETQPVAKAKINAQIEMVEDALKNTRKIAGVSDTENTVVVIDPDGNEFETTKANAEHLPKGWKLGK
jgi:hypothetical protein